ncbi:XRE family transcriptional regulator [Lacticaseibacillus rhamnosus]|uniref:helix-turn-helix domain-containing protein n=1 Tax=Lacticaseibacillus rhamnosus TaxID=47715 RepID=UPI0021A48D3E|nr:helix-turn-helix transcriptional regulator [Lacticaseibacillus rhamnosus]MCT3147327.1 XRE family transcriptional regulator [Lacticaseibacillus rhamnosus]WBM89896.1 hypothetical protein [Lacticaseibacillus phage R3.3]WNX18554.1 helix-turn-helix transcriptional regulator [Lacticaseibacillus rhamnosus]
MWDSVQKILDGRSISIPELADLAGYNNPSTLYMIRSGGIKDPSFSTMIRIADALGVSLDELRPDKQGEKKA